MKNSPTNTLSESAFDVFSDIKSRLEKSGIENSYLEARWILEDVLERDFSSVISGSLDNLGEESRSKLESMVCRRISREPLQYILGWAEFYGYRFHLEPGVLIPRPETEIIVDAAIKHLKNGEMDNPKILDLYTGSGNILLSILSKIESATGLGMDVDEKSIHCARKNAHSLGLSETRFIREDVRSYISHSEEKFQIITANPPYVPTSDIQSLQPEIKYYENHKALDGGPDGTAHLRILAEHAGKVLDPGGILISEIGIGQDESAFDIFSGWKSVQLIRDLSGTNRAILAVN